jgi:hypothetical protein
MLTAAAGNNYHWSNNASSQSITVGQSGSYSVTLTSGNNCTAASVPDSITVNPNPPNTVTAGGPISFCPGGSVTLTAAAGYNYYWSTTDITQSITVSQGGSYQVTVTNSNNCTAASSPVAVTVYSLPDNTITANGPTTICSFIHGATTPLHKVSPFIKAGFTLLHLPIPTIAARFPEWILSP